MKNIDNGTIVRTLVLFVAWFNQLLAVKGYSPLPFDDEMIEMGVSTIIAFCASVWAWWKNNNITRKARRNEEILKKEGLK
ncbi:phage holin [Domibacillus aminovorans]|uniref:Holin n=1 Tax=Domibacillus aminovorans TaxID=29332 RepID=A0A177LC56_9BACI|nr:phage holin [Domibacillus aminovorans]OAH63259.1 holin [Domibacillus aminovorans]